MVAPARVAVVGAGLIGQAHINRIWQSRTPSSQASLIHRPNRRPRPRDWVWRGRLISRPGRKAWRREHGGGVVLITLIH